MAVSKQIDWGDDSGDKISVEASEFSGNQVLRVTSQQNTRAYKRSIAIVVTSSSDPTKKATINLSQEAAPAILSLNVQSLTFSQRADTLEVQLTTNDNWQTSSNDEIPIPDEVTLKYNPWTDMVEMVGQPQQVYDAIQMSDDYIMAMVRVGYSNVSASYKRREAAEQPSAVNTLMDPRTMSERDNKSYRAYLVDNLNNSKFYRIIPRGYMREPGQVPIKQGINRVFDKGVDGPQITQAYLFPDSALVNKPGKVLGLRGCELVWPKSPHFLVDTGDGYFATSSSTWLNTSSDVVTKKLDPHTTSAFYYLTPSASNPNSKFVAPLMILSMESRSVNGPVGYILYKKKASSGYVVRGFDSVSNFALARLWVDESPEISSDGRFMIAKAHFGDL